MLPSYIGKTSIRAWTKDDLQKIVDSEAPESATLELKMDLPISNGSKGWRKSSKIHQSERDGIAKEIVALANAYGGHVIVGIKETTSTPKRAESLAEPLPMLSDLVDRLGSAISASIDPPIIGLDIVGIEVDSKNEGYIVISVPVSISSPHGVGNPPKSYIRRQDKSEPMTMRDMQSVFWEARSRRERIDSEFLKSRNELVEFPIRNDCLAFQFTAVSATEMMMPDLFMDIRSAEIFPDVRSRSISGVTPAAEWPFYLNDWGPEPTGSRFEYGYDSSGKWNRGYWEVDDTGVIRVVGEVKGSAFDSEEAHFPKIEVSPAWFSKTAGHLLHFSQKRATYAGNPDLDWIISGEFLALNPNVYVDHGNRFSRRTLVRRFLIPRGFRPTLNASESDLEAIDFIERRIWECFGLEKPADQVVIRSTISKELSRVT